MMTLGQAHQLLPASTLVGAPGTLIRRVHSDTRTLRHGDLFVALKGDAFDAHDFLADARAGGAVALLAERGVAECGLPGLVVEDSLIALQGLARGWRRGLSMPLIAVAGSNGKTTVTQMIGSILRAWLGDAALATAGNFNNHIGVPLTLLRLSATVRAAVVELGMNHPGEIAALAALAAPTVGLINNAQREHLEFMQDVAAVAQENGAVIDALPLSGTAVFPADDAHTAQWRERAGTRRIIAFGARGADVHATSTWSAAHWNVALHTPLGDTAFALHIAGAHNVSNALAAAAGAIAVGAPLSAVSAGLQAFAPVKGRSAAHRIEWRGQEVTLIDDSYNANPDSVLAAIDVLHALPAPRWLVLGDMGEVGLRGPDFHAEVGDYARRRGIDSFWCAGALSVHAAQAFGADARHFAATDSLITALANAPAAASILVKGSRFMHTERIVQALVQEAGDAA